MRWPWRQEKGAPGAAGFGIARPDGARSSI